MGWNEDGLGLWRICPICGKKFLPEVLHAYRDKTDPNRRFVCTYSCMRESERRLEERHKQDGRRLRARRLDPETMTEKQKRRQANRISVKCGTCSYAERKTVNGEDRVYCEHPDREYIYQHRSSYGNKNLLGLITVVRENDDKPYLRTPKWCPYKKEEQK